MSKSQVRLIHWSVEEAPAAVARLERAGYSVAYDQLATNDATDILLSNVPDAYVIDLSRLPALCREVGMFLRRQQASRDVPLVFVGGSHESGEQLRQILPGATHTPWENAGPALDEAINGAAQPTVPPSRIQAVSSASRTGAARSRTSVRLIHWSAEEARGRVALLEDAGYSVSYDQLSTNDATDVLLSQIPDVYVIDLSRLPALGREAGMFLRRHRATRNVPLFFVGGPEESVEQIRLVLPSAIYTPWENVGSAISETVGGAADPAGLASRLEMTSNTPLHIKLGIGAGYRVALVGAPDGFEDALGDLPEAAHVTRELRGLYDRIIFFTNSRSELQANAEALGGMLTARGGLWVVWPDKSSGRSSNVDQDVVRKVGLAAGLVDYKVAAIDSTWSGLLFARRSST